MSDKEQILWRCDPDMKAWLTEESERSGRSVTWLIQHAVGMWRRRLERQRHGRVSRSSVNSRKKRGG